MKYYTFKQNNSGGTYISPEYIIIKAETAEEANQFAQDWADVYFNGCDNGRDCNCCGDRWYPVDEHDGHDKPTLFEMVVEGTVEYMVKNYYDSVNLKYYPFVIRVYHAYDCVEEFSFTEAHINKAKNLVNQRKNSLYGFSFYENWQEPSPVYKMYQTDYEDNYYFAKNGNDSIVVGKDKNFNAEKGMLYVYDKSQDKVDEIRKQMVSVIEQANAEALNVVRKYESVLPKKVYKAIYAKFK